MADRLAAANRRAYRTALAQHAAAFGRKVPRNVQSQTVLAAIKQRAQVSAESITRTDLVARQRFYEDVGLPAARTLYRQWVAERAPLIAQFEAGMAAQAAANDFAQRNALQGTEHLEPRDAAVPDECQAAIDAGEVPFGELGDFPAHPRCPHYAVRTYDTEGVDAAALWVGGKDEE